MGHNRNENTDRKSFGMRLKSANHVGFKSVRKYTFVKSSFVTSVTAVKVYFGPLMALFFVPFYEILVVFFHEISQFASSYSLLAFCNSLLTTMTFNDR